MKDYKNIFLGEQLRNGQEEEVKGEEVKINSSLFIKFPLRFHATFLHEHRK